jgi:hypothetical protein
MIYFEASNASSGQYQRGSEKSVFNPKLLLHIKAITDISVVEEN